MMSMQMFWGALQHMLYTLNDPIITNTKVWKFWVGEGYETNCIAIRGIFWI